MMLQFQEMIKAFTLKLAPSFDLEKCDISLSQNEAGIYLEVFRHDTCIGSRLASHVENYSKILIETLQINKIVIYSDLERLEFAHNKELGIESNYPAIEDKDIDSMVMTTERSATPVQANNDISSIVIGGITFVPEQKVQENNGNISSSLIAEAINKAVAQAMAPITPKIEELNSKMQLLLEIEPAVGQSQDAESVVSSNGKSSAKAEKTQATKTLKTASDKHLPKRVNFKALKREHRVEAQIRASLKVIDPSEEKYFDIAREVFVAGSELGPMYLKAFMFGYDPATDGNRYKTRQKAILDKLEELFPGCSATLDSVDADDSTIVSTESGAS